MRRNIMVGSTLEAPGVLKRNGVSTLPARFLGYEIQFKLGVLLVRVAYKWMGS